MSQNLGGAPSRLGWVHSPGLALSAAGLFGVQRSNAVGRGGCLLLTCTLCCIDFKFLVLNNLVIDCLSGYVLAMC